MRLIGEGQRRRPDTVQIRHRVLQARDIVRQAGSQRGRQPAMAQKVCKRISRQERRFRMEIYARAR